MTERQDASRQMPDAMIWIDHEQAIITMRGLDERWVTSDMQTAFMRSGRSESVNCMCKVLRHGHTDQQTCDEADPAKHYSHGSHNNVPPYRKRVAGLLGEP